MSALLDPRWHWLRAALARLYAEIDNGARVEGLSVIARDGNELVGYSTAPSGPEIDRRVITDFDSLAAAVFAATVDVTPENLP